MPLLVVMAFAGYGAFWRYHLKRFQTVSEGVFYRVAQPTEIGMRHLIHHHGIKTVVSLQLFDFRLHGGFLDPGSPNGRKEAEFTEALGAHHVQWPMGTEKSWPWLSPWQFEEFFRLVDDPTNHPIIVHCMGGRHRTGTLSALYRLEFDGWTPEDTLREMYSFNFGGAINCQEHNLTTYVRRGRPSGEQWQALSAAFGPSAGEPALVDYADLVRRLRKATPDSRLKHEFGRYLAAGQPFAPTLAERVIESPRDPHAAAATDLAKRTLVGQAATPEKVDDAAVVSSTALIADYGTPAEQQYLLELLQRETRTPAPSAFYESLARGATNRYTPNRIAFLRPLIDDQRQRIGPSSKRYRYCDTAVIRLAAITDSLATGGWSEQHVAAEGRQIALKWFDENENQNKLSTLLPPTGRNVVQVGEGPKQEDLSRMRR
ncbi:MAG: tyrosine-protein phosphatase [Planctomycetia bacterium]|nr:tyrosine-protein phosphatase [Planctomycetia bacterium]